MKNIAVIGAGISGLYLANLLEKEIDFEYKIYEKRSKFNLEEGYGIQLSVNSIKLLNKIGFKNLSVHDLSYPKRVNFVDAKNNNKICDIDINKFNDESNYYTTLKRSTLIKFLLDDIPDSKINHNVELKKVEYGEKLNAHFSNNTIENFDYIIVSDGVFSNSKSIIAEKHIAPKFFKSVALRGNIKNYDNPDVSIFMGSNFHFVIYPVNQNKDYNFISIIRKNLSKEQLADEKLFENNDFLQSLLGTINQNSFLDIKSNLENIKAFPIFVSEKIEIINKKNIFFVGDALFSFPPSFAQGASQSIETSNDLFQNIKNNNDIFYKERINKINSVNWRSKLNHFAFHLKNPLSIFIRNICLKYLTKNEKFLENYLGKIYRD
ncbi:MAG TPA: NAD(P)/FAD-dependent oxidoreductase [Candidatus Pelagibacter bacterium]|jgi:salicylate hydroxylase|nr:NAD(P)/FAD-dependent oxidoreductase [Candidatus Pelagibacter bacterium]